jgi:hypothetical protein
LSTGAAAAAVTGAQGGGYLVSTFMAALRGALATVGLGVRSVDTVKYPPTSTAIANSRLPWCNEHPESGAAVHVLGYTTPQTLAKAQQFWLQRMQ